MKRSTTHPQVHPLATIDRIEKFFARVGDFCQIVGATVVLIVLGHCALAIVYLFVDVYLKTDVRNTSPVYDNFPEASEYWNEFEESYSPHFEPFFHHRRDAYAGKFINISQDGVRRTVKPSSVTGEIKVFVIGGSTMWGTGVPDDKTIPSILQSLLGDHYDVYNFGESGFMSAHELNYLLFQLAHGNIPDIVIFYDGVNDGYAGAYSPAVPREPRLRFQRMRFGTHNPLIDLYRGSSYSRLIGYLTRAASTRRWEERVAQNILKNSNAVVDIYEAHIKQVKAIAKDYGFEAYFFWQPHLFSLTRSPFDDYERRVIEAASPVLVESQRQVFLAAKERFSGREEDNIHFLGHVFDDVAELIYIDWNHIGPNGSEIIAQEMFRRLGVESSDGNRTTRGPSWRERR